MTTLLIIARRAALLSVTCLKVNAVNNNFCFGTDIKFCRFAPLTMPIRYAKIYY